MIENPLKKQETVNKEAQKERHRRIFSRPMCFIHFCKRIAGHFGTVKTLISRFFFGEPMSADVMIDDQGPITHNHFFQKVIFFSIILFLFASFTPSGYFLDTGFAADYLSDNEEDYAINSRFYNVEFITTEEGYLLKQEPQTEEVSRIGMKDMAVHIVQQGETITSIASQYGVKAETIVWENNIDPNRIALGQKLYIPPIDGVSYTVKSGDTLNKIAEKFKVDVSIIANHNKIVDNIVKKSDAIFIPNGKPLTPPKPVIAQGGRKPQAGKGFVEKESAQGTSAAPSGGKSLIFPTTGSLTQGFKRGHYAVDIGNRNKPPVWSAAEGTVIKASTGTYGGGYGNHVVIDHGGGLQTLYGHLEEVYVKVDESVSQGQVIGKMGRTGRVYGPTGIHLHFEVIKNGVKQNPAKYY